MRGLFQSERANMLRISEANEAGHQALQHLLTEDCVDWQGFAKSINRTFIQRPSLIKKAEPPAATLRCRSRQSGFP